MDPLDRIAGGVDPGLDAYEEAQEEAFQEAIEFDAAIAEDEWPFDDDPPDPL